MRRNRAKDLSTTEACDGTAPKACQQQRRAPARQLYQPHELEDEADDSLSVPPWKRVLRATAQSRPSSEASQAFNESRKTEIVTSPRASAAVCLYVGKAANSAPSAPRRAACKAATSAFSNVEGQVAARVSREAPPQANRKLPSNAGASLRNAFRLGAAPGSSMRLLPDRKNGDMPCVSTKI